MDMQRLKSAGEAFNELPPDVRATACHYCYASGWCGGNGETPYECPECLGTGKKRQPPTPPPHQ